MEHILSMIGLAHKAGRVEIGEEPVGGAARAKRSRVILVAQDAAASSYRRAMGFANAGACLCLTVPADKDALRPGDVLTSDGNLDDSTFLRTRRVHEAYVALLGERRDGTEHSRSNNCQYPSHRAISIISVSIPLLWPSFP